MLSLLFASVAGVDDFAATGAGRTDRGAEGATGLEVGLVDLGDSVVFFSVATRPRVLLRDTAGAAFESAVLLIGEARDALFEVAGVPGFRFSLSRFETGLLDSSERVEDRGFGVVLDVVAVELVAIRRAVVAINGRVGGLLKPLLVD